MQLLRQSINVAILKGNMESVKCQLTRYIRTYGYDEFVIELQKRQELKDN